jgi:hypothetical protein
MSRPGSATPGVGAASGSDAARNYYTETVSPIW